MEEVKVLWPEFAELAEFTGPPDPRRIMIVGASSHVHLLLGILAIEAKMDKVFSSEVIELGLLSTVRELPKQMLLMEDGGREIAQLIASMYSRDVFLPEVMPEFQRVYAKPLHDQVSAYLPTSYRNVRTLKRSAKNHRGKKSKGR